MLMSSTFIRRNDKHTISTSRKQIEDWWSRVEKTATTIFAEEVAAEKGAASLLVYSEENLDFKLREIR